MVAYSPAVPNFVTVNCDGCGNDIPHGTYWYRDMEIQEDLDLCKTCFTSESMVDSEHCTLFLSLHHQGAQERDLTVTLKTSCSSVLG